MNKRFELKKGISNYYDGSSATVAYDNITLRMRAKNGAISLENRLIVNEEWFGKYPTHIKSKRYEGPLLLAMDEKFPLSRKMCRLRQKPINEYYY